MSFLSILKKIALPAASLAAVPFTGGTSLLGMLGMGAKTAGMIGTGLGVAGKLAGGAANQRSADRGAQTEYNLLNDQNRLNYAKFNQASDATNLRRGLSGDLLNSFQRPTDPRAEKFFGGKIDPAMVLRMQTSRTDHMTPTAQPQPGGGDSFLRSLSMAGTVADAAKQFMPKPQAPLPQEPQVGSLEDWIYNREKGGYA